MEVAALCIQICMLVFLLLSTQPGLSYTVQKPAFPIVSPDRLQFFNYESVSVSCGGDTDVNAWRVMRKLHTMSPINVSEGCSVSAPSCTISNTLEKHSGEYWCENHEGERSYALNISVTAGPVILNLPAQPVEEGSHVTLQCIKENTDKSHFSDFYKDGHALGTGYESHMILSKVSKFDEGLYKCSISDVGESPESRLTVVTPKDKEEGSNDETQPLTNWSHILIILLSTIFTLLLLVIGLVLYQKHRALKNETISVAKDTTYAVVNKPKKRNAGGDTANDMSDVTYASIDIKKEGSEVPRATNQHSASEQETVYSFITLQNLK